MLDFIHLPFDPLSTLLQPASQEANTYGLSQWGPSLSAFPFDSAKDLGMGAE